MTLKRVMVGKELSQFASKKKEAKSEPSSEDHLPRDKVHKCTSIISYCSTVSSLVLLVKSKL